MTESNDSIDELDAQQQEVVQRLDAHRPVPSAGFRGTLGRRLAANDPGYGPRPAKLRLIVAAYGAAGTTVVAVGALVATGVV